MTVDRSRAMPGSGRVPAPEGPADPAAPGHPARVGDPVDYPIPPPAARPGDVVDAVENSHADVRPGLLAMAGSLAKSAIRHVADGARKASPEVQAERKATCMACSHLDKTRDRCTVCGCVHMDVKRSWASEKCPLEQPRWGVEE